MGQHGPLFTPPGIHIDNATHVIYNSLVSMFEEAGKGRISGVNVAVTFQSFVEHISMIERNYEEMEKAAVRLVRAPEFKHRFIIDGGSSVITLRNAYDPILSSGTSHTPARRRRPHSRTRAHQ